MRQIYVMVEPSQMAEIRHLVSVDFKIISTFTARAPNPAALFLINATTRTQPSLSLNTGVRRSGIVNS